MKYRGLRIFQDRSQKLSEPLRFGREIQVRIAPGSKGRIQVHGVKPALPERIWNQDRVPSDRIDPPGLG